MKLGIETESWHPSRPTGPFPAVMFCRAPMAASWVWWRTLRAISDRYMRIVMLLHSHSMPRGLAFSSRRGHFRAECWEETLYELQLISYHWVHQEPAIKQQIYIIYCVSVSFFSSLLVHFKRLSIYSLLQHHHAVNSHHQKEFTQSSAVTEQLQCRCLLKGSDGHAETCEKGFIQSKVLDFWCTVPACGCVSVCTRYLTMPIR